jgi:hypothetical protein
MQAYNLSYPRESFYIHNIYSHKGSHNLYYFY